MSVSREMRPLRVLPRGRLRAANFVYQRRYEGKNGDLRNATLRDGARFALDVGEWPQAQAFLLGEYDPSTVDFIASNLPSGGVFFDVGAHVGLISFQVLQRRKATVHAFEPHPVRGEQFQRNAKLNNAQVYFNPVGLSDTAGDVSYDLDRHKVIEADDSISVVRLDDYLDEHSIEKVDVLKLDIEGHELQALKGAERALSEGRIGAVTLEAMEAHGDTAGPRELLEGFGYQAHILDPPNMGYVKN